METKKPTPTQTAVSPLYLFTLTYTDNNNHYDVNSSKSCISLAVLSLQEDGELHNLKKKWWHDRSECGQNDGTKVLFHSFRPMRVFVFL